MNAKSITASLFVLEDGKKGKEGKNYQF